MSNQERRAQEKAPGFYSPEAVAPEPDHFCDLFRFPDPFDGYFDDQVIGIGPKRRGICGSIHSVFGWQH